MHRWDETELWSRLSQIAEQRAPEIAATVELLLPRAQRAFEAGYRGIDPVVTSDHPWRVAQAMWEVIPDDVRCALWPHELGLLLFGAYIHDIGLSAGAGFLADHHDYLRTGAIDRLTAEDRAAFQDWLDRHYDGFQPPLDPAPPSADRHPRSIVYRYARDRHGEWAERWLEAHTDSAFDTRTYPGFRADIARLCRSHREGLHALASDDLSPRFVQGGDIVVHRRYLACVLRVADALGLDPDRAPDALLDADGQPLTDWAMEQSLDASIQRDNERVIARARPRSAPAYRAVDATLDAIEDELRLVCDLDAMLPFQSAPRRGRVLPHRWALQPVLYRDVRPRDDAFVYVDGAFRPNTEKLLQLLGGRELYGDELLGLRELVQNAFDAVRERLAWQRVAQPDPNADEAVDALRRLHRVDLSVSTDADGRQWLVCRDTGAGMSRDILVNYLLVSGTGRHPDLYELSRRARAAGFELERTGRFGIGVLSYFMLADRLEIRTRRCLEARSGGGEAWSFGTDGVGSFGELRRDPDWREGTEVRLRLRGAQRGVFRSLLSDILIRVPCRLTFTAPHETRLDLGPGWTVGLDGLTKQFMPRVARDSGADEEHVRQSVDRTMRWAQREGEFSNGLGAFRVSVPYFDLPGGRSLVFLNAHLAGDRVRVGNVAGGEFLLPRYVPRYATDGAALRSTEREPIIGRRSRRRHHERTHDERHYYFEIDWNSAQRAPLTARRDQVRRDDRVSAAMDEAMSAYRELVHDLLLADQASVYARLSRKVARLGDDSLPLLSGENAWLYRDADGGEMTWGPLPVPFTTGGRGARSVRLRDRPVSRVLRPAHRAGALTASQTWPTQRDHPSELCLDVDGDWFAAIYDTTSPRVESWVGMIPVRFPAALIDLAAAVRYGDGYLNAAHPVVEEMEIGVQSAWAASLEKRMPLDEQIEALLSEPTHLPSWFCAVVGLFGRIRIGRERAIQAPSYWTAVAERSPRVPEMLFDLVGGGRTVMSVLERSGTKVQVHDFTRTGHSSQSVSNVADVPGRWRLSADSRLMAHG